MNLKSRALSSLAPTKENLASVFCSSVENLLFTVVVVVVVVMGFVKSFYICICCPRVFMLFN